MTLQATDIMPRSSSRFSLVDPTRVGVAAALIASLLLQPTTVLAADRIAVYTEQSYPLSYTENGADDGQIMGFATQLVIAVLE